MEDLTWNEQYAVDNTWQKQGKTCEDECPHCEFFGPHPVTEGSTAWDRYSYSTCLNCFKTF